jgi:hypothetical protein
VFSGVAGGGRFRGEVPTEDVSGHLGLGFGHCCGGKEVEAVCGREVEVMGILLTYMGVAFCDA